MKPTLALVLALVPLGCTSVEIAPIQDASPRAAAQDGPLKVEPDPYNVAAMGLIGDWSPDPELWARFRGEQLELPPGTAMPIVTFARDDAVLERMSPAAVAEIRRGLGGAPILLAGTVSNLVSAEPALFFLTTVHGNSHVVGFLERDGDPTGDAESFNVSVVIAKEPGQDLLFVGSDFQTRHESFRPFRRASAAGGEGGEGASRGTGAAGAGKRPGAKSRDGFRASVAKAKADIVTIEMACKEYAIRNQMRYPDDLEALVRKDANGRSYLEGDGVPKDPWGNEYLYDPPRDGAASPTIITLGADGRVGGEGEDRDFDNHMIRNREI